MRFAKNIYKETDILKKNLNSDSYEFSHEILTLLY
jgi:hypothetical protein